MHLEIPRVPILSDADLEFWGRVYEAYPQILDRGVLFETFLLAPREIIVALQINYVVDLDDAELRDLALDALVERQRAKRRAPLVVHRDCGWIEPIHHHRWARPKPARPHAPKTLEVSR